MIDFEPTGLEMTAQRQQIRESVKAMCDAYDDDYWSGKDQRHEFPHEFRATVASEGWLGITMPEEYGGAGLGVTEAALLMQTVAQSAGAISACSTFHINLFGPHPVLIHGTEEQRRRIIPPLIEGKDIVAFGVTEPDAGLDTTRITTRAVRDGDKYIVNGQKIWTTTALEANRILLATRTTPREQAKSRTHGLTIFYTDLNRDHIEVRPIDKMGRSAVDSNMTFYRDLPVPEDHRIGAEDEGFRYLLDSLNPERILVAAECIGVGRRALAKAVEYAGVRNVFGRPIGMNQSIQHPLAEAWMALEAADMMVWKAAALYDAGKPCGAEANAAKFLAADAAFATCDQAVRTHGGMGYSREFHVERYLREIMLPRIAPVSREMIMNFVSERVLGLPKSY